MSASSERTSQGKSGRRENSDPMDTNLIIMIAAMCDTPTKAVSCLLNRQLCGPLQMSLFKCVEIRERHQLDAFARCVSEAVFDENGRGDRRRELLAQVQCFIHRPSISPLWSQMHHPESTISKLSIIPQTTKSGRVIFPRLEQARLTFKPDLYLDPLPGVVTPPAGILPSEGYQTCFLAKVKILRLDDFAPQPIFDLDPAFQMLGMRNLVSVILMCKFGQAPYDEVSLYFRSQRGLRNVTIRERDYCRSNDHRQVTRVLDRYPLALFEFMGHWNFGSLWPDLTQLVLHTVQDESRVLMPSIVVVLARLASSGQWSFVTSRFCYRFGSGGTTVRPFLGMVQPIPLNDAVSSDDGDTDDSGYSSSIVGDYLDLNA